MQKPHCSIGSVLLFLERESGNFWFPSRCSRARDPLLSLCEQSQPVGDSEHMFMYPVFQLSILVGPLDRLLRGLGNTVVVVLTRVPGQLVGQVVASPVVPGHPAIVLVLLCLISWDPFHMYGVRTPGCDDPFPENPQVPIRTIDPVAWSAPSVLDPSESLDDSLIVDGNSDGSRTVRSDGGSGKLHPREVADSRTHCTVSSCGVASRFGQLRLNSV